MSRAGEGRLRSVLRSFAAGAVAAASMSGLRNITTGLGLLDEVPPRQILAETAPALIRRLGEGREKAVAELAHWAYGAACGAVYGAGVRALGRSGPGLGAAYGLGTLTAYRIVIAPVLGIEPIDARSARARAALLADHLLFGVVLDRLAVPPDEA